VVGQALEARDDAVDQLRAQLLVAGPVALLLASLAGYLTAAGALRPVVRMTRRAGDIDAATPGARLPVPRARDEIRELGTTLNGMLDRIAAAFARERAFVADASHELRTPLAILRAELDLALRTARTPAEYRAAVASAGEEADRLGLLADDLLVLARADQGQLPVRPEPVALGPLLAATAGRFATRAQAHGIALEVLPPEVETVAADPLRLGQALGNLVDNALRHAATTVVLTAERDGDAVALVVRDDGPGFPPGFAERAFDRFARAEGGTGGAGLGLAIVAAIAEAHGGRATARTHPAGGAEVRLIVLSPAVANVPPA
jgi:two-component system, OmpR family, sensor kinase